ncbi:hypothetical protein E2C01_040045 [Portunus trituberculatus]|uniref:Uncharacterized protein n=1 Tax=Portunus trituberculatus TaxID=210409 RepID=A0A5B7FMX7_PORTR|nr:hypothetical protein [Portunus trituberculatus]
MMVCKGRGKSKLVVNNEISKDGDLRKRVEGQNVLHFGNTTSSFGAKMRIEKVGGNREGAAVNCLRQLCFGEEKMRFSRGEVVFYRLKIRSKTVNVAEVKEGKVEGGVSIPKEYSDLRTFLVPSPEGDSEDGFGVAILIFEF